MGNLYKEEGHIGRPGTVVEIEECRIGRRKYDREHIVEGSWILGEYNIVFSVNI